MAIRKTISKRVLTALLTLPFLLSACGGPPEFSNAPGTLAPWEEQKKLVGTWTAQKGLTDAVTADPSKHGKRYISLALAQVLPTPDGRLSIMFGYTRHEVEAMTANNRSNWSIKTGVTLLRGSGHIVVLDEQRYLVFRRDPGLFDDYTGESMTPGYNIFHLMFSGVDRVRIAPISGRKLKEAFGHEKIKVTKVTGTNINGEVPYFYMDVTGPQITKILKETETKHLVDSTGVGFARPQATLWNLP